MAKVTIEIEETGCFNGEKISVTIGMNDDDPVLDVLRSIMVEKSDNLNRGHLIENYKAARDR